MKSSSKKRFEGIELLEAAVGEYKDFGKVIGVECDSCGSLIEIIELNESALAVQCPCGKFKDILRGI